MQFAGLCTGRRKAPSSVGISHHPGEDSHSLTAHFFHTELSTSDARKTVSVPLPSPPGSPRLSKLCLLLQALGKGKSSLSPYSKNCRHKHLQFLYYTTVPKGEAKIKMLGKRQQCIIGLVIQKRQKTINYLLCKSNQGEGGMSCKEVIWSSIFGAQRNFETTFGILKWREKCSDML